MHCTSGFPLGTQGWFSARRAIEVVCSMPSQCEQSTGQGSTLWGSPPQATRAASLSSPSISWGPPGPWGCAEHRDLVSCLYQGAEVNGPKVRMAQGQRLLQLGKGSCHSAVCWLTREEPCSAGCSLNLLRISLGWILFLNKTGASSTSNPFMSHHRIVTEQSHYNDHSVHKGSLITLPNIATLPFHIAVILMWK